MIINTYITAKVSDFESLSKDPTDLMEDAAIALKRILGGNEDPIYNLEDVIAMLIVANGDF